MTSELAPRVMECRYCGTALHFFVVEIVEQLRTGRTRTVKRATWADDDDHSICPANNGQHEPRRQ